jgi:hypothetical protein
MYRLCKEEPKYSVPKSLYIYIYIYTSIELDKSLSFRHVGDICVYQQAYATDRKKESSPENEGAKAWVPLYLSNDQKTPYSEMHQHDGRSELMHHLIGKLFSQGRDAEQSSPP